MSRGLHGKTCTLVLFEQPGGEIRALHVTSGTLDVGGDGVRLLPEGGGDPVRLPPHLVEDVEPVTDEHRACVDEITGDYCLRAFYDGRLPRRGPIDLHALLARSSGPPAAE
jgi:hypothetical protein